MIKREVGFGGLEPRSHSLVVRATGNRVGLSLGSSNLSLGANTATSMSGRWMVCSMERDEHGHQRRWTLVFLFGVLFHIYAAMHSDLGLDAHVRMNALNDEQTEGQDLTWGAPRISSSSSVNTTAVYDGYIPPWNASESIMKITAVSSLVLVALLVACRPWDQPSPGRFEPRWAALLMLSPVLMFSTSRGYDEAPLALLMGLGVVGYWLNRGETPAQQRLNGGLMATSILLVMLWKGFSPLASFSAWAVMVLATEVWIGLCRSSSLTREGERLGNPWAVGFMTFIVVYFGIVFTGFATSTGTFSIIGEHPFQFLIASFFALLDTVVLYLLVGCLLWPFLLNRWPKLRVARGPGLTMLVVYICGVLAGIVAYVASLWTLEAALWDMSLAKVMVMLGNNGRYATLLLIPLVALLRWDGVDEANTAGSRDRFSVRAVVLILPFLLFTGLIGHQIWSEDAGELLAKSWGEDDDTFLLVAPESMAMHHLYVLKSNLDLDGSQGIQGLWANPSTATDVIEEYGATIDYVLVAPETSFDANTTSWVLVEAREVPVSVPGGIQGGTWSLYRLTA